MSKEEIKVKMISAVSEVLNLRKNKNSLDNEEIMQHISKAAEKEGSNQVKLGMLAAASKALNYKERNPSMPDNEIIKSIMASLDELLVHIIQENR